MSHCYGEGKAALSSQLTFPRRSFSNTAGRCGRPETRASPAESHAQPVSAFSQLQREIITFMACATPEDNGVTPDLLRVTEQNLI